MQCGWATAQGRPHTDLAIRQRFPSPLFDQVKSGSLPDGVGSRPLMRKML